MDLENISRVQGGSLLQVSNYDHPFGNPVLIDKMHNIVCVAEGILLITPYKSPRKEEDWNPHNANQRKLDIVEFTTTTNSNKGGWMLTKLCKGKDPKDRIDHTNVAQISHTQGQGN